jgi:hypothetical protein
LQGALVTDYDPRQSEGWNAARPFKVNQEENRRRSAGGEGVSQS